MVRLYLDENVNILLVPLLRARNIEISSTLEHNNLGKTDSQQLEFAASVDSALVTHNRADFEALFREYLQEERSNSGIIILIRREVHQMAQRLSRFCLIHEAIKNEIHFV